MDTKSTQECGYSNKCSRIPPICPSGERRNFMTMKCETEFFITAEIRQTAERAIKQIWG
jgi:hypothetical protein